jgi:hypothetical protein
MDQIQINLFTVLVAAILNMAIGFVWYSKWLFGPAWMHLQKTTMGAPSKMTLLYSLIVSLVIAFFISYFQAYVGVTTVIDGMFLGFCLWLGFVATTQISSVIWAKQPYQLFFIDTSCKLLSFLVMSGVIGA